MQLHFEVQPKVQRKTAPGGNDMQTIIGARLLNSDAAKPRATAFDLRDSRLTGFILRVQPSGTRAYFAQVARGKRVKLGDVGHGRHALAGIEAPASGVTLRQFIDDKWTTWAKAKRRKSWSKTLNAVRCHFTDWFDKPISSITRAMIDEHITKRLANGDKPSSVRRDTDALAGMLTRAVACELIPASPMKGVEKPKLDRNPKVRYLSVDEERRLRAALAERDAEMIAALDNANKTRRR